MKRKSSKLRNESEQAREERQRENDRERGVKREVERSTYYDGTRPSSFMLWV